MMGRICCKNIYNSIFLDYTFQHVYLFQIVLGSVQCVTRQQTVLKVTHVLLYYTPNKETPPSQRLVEVQEKILIVIVMTWCLHTLVWICALLGFVTPNSAIIATALEKSLFLILFSQYLSVQHSHCQGVLHLNNLNYCQLQKREIQKNSKDY